MARSTTPDLYALMNAYAVLEAEYSAWPLEVRAAYRRLADGCHPDRFATGSPEQEHATTRMASINDAYRLIRDAPLRYHPVSRESSSDVAWDDAELDRAMRRARAGGRMADFAGMAVCVALSVLLAVLLVGWLDAMRVPGSAAYAVLLPVAFGAVGASLGRRFLAYWYAMDLFLAVARFVYR